MAISTAIQKGTSVYVYNEKKQTSATISLSGGTVHSCTGTINIKRGTTIYMYNENGRQVGTTYAK